MGRPNIRPFLPFRKAAFAASHAVVLAAAALLLPAFVPATVVAEERSSYIVQLVQNERFPNAAGHDDSELGLPAGSVTSRRPRSRVLSALLTREQAEQLQRDPRVESVEPNHEVSLSYTPNDARLLELIGLIGAKGIRAAEAWDITQGSADQVIAVIDTGLDYNHPDLVGNIWTNPGEVPANGIDDDKNGVVDDVRGYDFTGEDNDVMDGFGHGTHVAGIIAATGDNAAGVVGVSWRSKILPVKAMGDSGFGSYYDILQSIDYVVDMKRAGAPIRAVNLSIGGLQYSNAWYRALQRAREADLIVIAAAGNAGENSDRSPQYPAAFDLPNIISVAAVSSEGALASFSNYGKESVDLGAPGVGILSTYPLASSSGAYVTKSGTSMASPHVAGIAALIAAANPDITARQVRSLILGTTRPLRALAGRTSRGGLADAGAAVEKSVSMSRKLEVYGRVRRGPLGVPGVTVRARPVSGTQGSRQSVSGSDGSFLITGLAPGSYVISANKAGTRFERRTVLVSVTSDHKQGFSVSR